MKPKKSPQKNRQRDLFRPELSKIIDPGHALVKLAHAVEWNRMDELFGKAHKRYEFGCKVSVAATSRGGWIVGAMATHGNPYDGYTLKDALEQIKRVVHRPEQVFVDQGYRGNGYTGKVQVHVDKHHRGRTAKSLWRWMKRRAAIVPGIGHLKREHGMDRNLLKGTQGDRINAILSAAGMNFWKLLRWVADFLRQFYFWHLYCQRSAAISTN